MDFEALRCFVRIAEGQSISAAAKLHGLPKSTLSLKLRQLEADVGSELFGRDGRALRLTDAGEELLRHAHAILAACESARSAVAEVREEIAGTLRVGFSGEFGTAFNAQMLYAFRRRHPKVKLDLVFFSASTLFDLDRLQAIDAIVAWDAVGAGGHDSVRLSSTRFGLFASPAYLAEAGVPEAPADLRRHRGVLYRTATGLQSWRLCRADETVDVLPADDLVANEYWTVKYFAVGGDGIAYLPRFFTRMECARGHLVPVLPDWLSEERFVHLYFPRGQDSSRKSAAFRDFCADYFRPEFAFDGPEYYFEALSGPHAPEPATTGPERRVA